MIGLPFETDEDVKGIYELAKKVVDRCRPINKRLNVNSKCIKLCT